MQVYLVTLAVLTLPSWEGPSLQQDYWLGGNPPTNALPLGLGGPFQYTLEAPALEGQIYLRGHTPFRVCVSLSLTVALRVCQEGLPRRVSGSSFALDQCR